MPEANTATYLRDNAANFRRLAKEQNEAGHYPIFAKLTEVASDLEAEAADLDSENASNVIWPLLTLILEDGGYDVLNADDGLRRMVAFRSGQPDFVITDIIMPE
jgi:CheY-like chemotaxis protein